MASTSKVQCDVDAELQSPGVATSIAASDAPVGGEETGRVHGDLPDIFNVEWQREGMPDTEFNRKYPPDAWGEEIASKARIWKIYHDQQHVSHNSMPHGWNKTLDVLLIFAGLFSAVLTAFLVESYKALQPDYTQYIATFLYAAAGSHNRTGVIFPAFDTLVAPDLFVQTSSAQRWTNGLWFSSLVISLTVALFCILIKQWLDAYDAHVSAAAQSPIHWARRHSLYHRGLDKRGVPGLISFLPLLLHLSLFLFFVGLILFLRPLDGTISILLLAMVSCIATFYVLSLVLPAWHVDCPSYTPLLASALLALSRTISVPLYVVHELERRVRCVALFNLTMHAQQWLRSIQQSAGQHLTRETQTISECDQELDGLVLSSLIHLPTDANRDILNPVIAAIGAVTSTRTIDVVTRTVTKDVFQSKMYAFYDDIRSNETGFDITLHAHLRRAHAAMSIHGKGVHRHFLYMPAHAPGISPSLGLDGLLMEALRLTYSDRETDMNFLIRLLQSLPPSGDNSHGYPLRFTCLMFLEDLSLYGLRSNNPEFLSCFLLVFCAGRFASAGMHKLVRALGSVQTMLPPQHSLTLPAHNGGEQDCILAAVNGLWIILADYKRYFIDTLTAQIVAHHAVVCFKRVSYFPRCSALSRLPGLSRFIRSPTFNECAGTGDSSAEYTSLFWAFMVCTTAREMLENHWSCIAAIVKLSWDCMPGPKEAASLHMMNEVFPGQAALPDDRCEPELSAFLDGPNAIATWSGIDSPDHANGCIIALAELADRISVVLCRRKQLGCTSDAFLPIFFSGPFVFARFRDFVSREHVLGEDDREPVERRLLGLAKHCLKLAPESFMAILTRLEETGDTGSQLRARSVAFAQRIRDSNEPGGDLSEECRWTCSINGNRVTHSREKAWCSLVTWIRRRRTDPVPAEHV